MRYYPVNLDIKGRQCLVVGGGRVGSRKVDTLVQCGAVVTVVSADVSPTVKQLADEKAILLKQRAYRASDVEGMFLVIGATDNETLNRQINADAERLNLLCNIADRPEICNFILPAIVRRGRFVMAISTPRKSPAFAKHVRKRLETQTSRICDLVHQVLRAVDINPDITAAGPSRIMHPQVISGIAPNRDRCAGT